MNNIERFKKTMTFQAVDHPPIILDEPWPRTKERWKKEGMPEGINLYDYFELEPFNIVNVGPATSYYPDPVETVIEKNDKYMIFTDCRGVKCRCELDYMEGIEYLEYPIKGSIDKEWLQDYLNPDDPKRLQNGWDKKLSNLNPDHDFGTIDFGSYFGDLHERMGTEAVSFIFFDEPDFVHWYNDRIASCAENAIKKVLPDDRVVFMVGHEDMAFKNGSFISPEMFREFLTPYYKRTVGLARKLGQTIFWQDSDGDVHDLIPLWLEAGINLVTPLEVAAGMDVIKLRTQYGKDLLMCGGIDKRSLISGKEAIKREISTKEKVIAEGGYIPRLDHTVPPDISWENYQGYVNLLKSVYGI